MAKLKWIVPGVVATLLLGHYILFVYSPSANDQGFNLSIQMFRSVANGKGPDKVNGLLVAEGEFPAGAIVAGRTLFKKTPLVFTSYQLVYSDGSRIIIDAVHDSHQHKEAYGGNPYYPEAYDEMQAGMKEADLILATHEHFDHVGGIAKSPYLNDILANVKLTPEQIEGPTMPDAGFPGESLSRMEPLHYSGVYSPAPGLAVMKAPGHSNGSQFIYVVRSDGQEFLFVGDVAWNRMNILEGTGRPAIVSWLFLGEDRQAVANQLRAIKKVQAEDPDLNVVISHDPDDFHRLRREETIGPSFE